MGEIVELIIVASNLDNVVSCLLNYPENNYTEQNPIGEKSKTEPKKRQKYIILHESEKEKKLHFILPEWKFRGEVHKSLVFLVRFLC